MLFYILYFYNSRSLFNSCPSLSFSLYHICLALSLSLSFSPIPVSLFLPPLSFFLSLSNPGLSPFLSPTHGLLLSVSLPPCLSFYLFLSLFISHYCLSFFFLSSIPVSLSLYLWFTLCGFLFLFLSRSCLSFYLFSLSLYHPCLSPFLSLLSLSLSLPHLYPLSPTPVSLSHT